MSTATAQPTARPWAVSGGYSEAGHDPGDCEVEIYANSAEPGDMLPALAFGDTREKAFANAAHIVRCVNAFDDLLAACRGLLEHAWDGRRKDVKKHYHVMVAEEAARAAIAKATGNITE